MVDPIPSPLDALKPLAGRTLEAALNRALALDPDTRAAVAALSGRSVVLRLEAPPLALQLTVDDACLRVGPVDADRAPDLSVRGTLAGLLAQLPGLGGDPSRSDAGVQAGRVHIEGDAELARQLQRLARRFDPDWQQPFASVFGDVLGVQIADAFAAALRQARATGAALAQSTAEYLTEEARDVVGRDELDAFLDDVDATRDAAERIEVRIRRLREAVASRRGAEGAA